MPKVPTKRKVKDGDDESSKKRKQKKKKDPNAPKRAMSGFMFFSNSEREVRHLEMGPVFVLVLYYLFALTACCTIGKLVEPSCEFGMHFEFAC